MTTLPSWFMELSYTYIFFLLLLLFSSFLFVWLKYSSGNKLKLKKTKKLNDGPTKMTGQKTLKLLLSCYFLLISIAKLYFCGSLKKYSLNKASCLSAVVKKTLFLNLIKLYFCGSPKYTFLFGKSAIRHNSDMQIKS